jgi:F-type H+-transporting ATPase subunit epsilon
MERMQVMVVSPEQVMFEGDADMVVCRTTDGDVAFLPGHAPFLGALGTAQVRVILPEGDGGGGEVAIAVHEGFVEVTSEHVVVLSDVAELPDQIDVARARAAKERAEAAIATDPEDEDAAAALARADLRLEVAGANAAA